MSEPHQEVPAVDAERDVPAPVAAPRRYRGIALTLAALVLLAGLAGSAPFWAPALPWAPPNSPPPDPRIDEIATALQQARQQGAAQSETAQLIERRLAALESRPAASAGDSAELRQLITALAARFEALDKKLAALQQASGDLGSRLAADEAATQAQKAADAELTQRLDRLVAATQQGAADGNDTAVVLVLLQIHAALTVGRPFGAEYDALAGLVRNRPELAAAVAPLAAPAKSGVATPAVLAARLRQLAPAIAKPPPATDAVAPGATGWGEAVLDRVQGLVRVRRLDATGAETSGAAATTDPVSIGAAPAADAALRELAAGDVGAAVAALERLDGPAAAATQSWLRMAKDRLAAEAAMQQVETLLAARLGAPANPAANPVAPPGSPR